MSKHMKRYELRVTDNLGRFLMMFKTRAPMSEQAAKLWHTVISKRILNHFPQPENLRISVTEVNNWWSPEV